MTAGKGRKVIDDMAGVKGGAKGVDIRDEIRREAGRRRGFMVSSELDAAAALLADLYAAGERHGIARERWGWVASVAGACVDVVSGRHRGAIPEEPEQAVSLLDSVREALATDHGVATRRDVLYVPLPRVDETPAWGGRPLAVSMSIDGGWCLVLHGGQMSPVVTVSAPFTADGAREVAGLAVEVNAGVHGNPFGG